MSKKSSLRRLFAKEDEGVLRVHVPELGREVRVKTRPQETVSDVIGRILRKHGAKHTGQKPESYWLVRAPAIDRLEEGKVLGDSQTIGECEINDHDVFVIRQRSPSQSGSVDASTAEDDRNSPLSAVTSTNESELAVESRDASPTLNDLANFGCDSHGVPVGLAEALDYLEEHSAEGPMTKAEATPLVESYLAKLYNGQPQNYKADNASPSLAAAVVCQFLWANEEPLLTSSLITFFYTALGLQDPQASEDCLHASVLCLPQLNRNVLKRLCSVASSTPGSWPIISQTVGPSVGWLPQEREEGKEACIVGQTILSSLIGSSPELFEVNTPCPVVALAEAAHDWTARTTDELSLSVGEILFVTAEGADWCKATTVQGCGLVPTNHVQVLAYIPNAAKPQEANEILSETFDEQQPLVASQDRTAGKLFPNNESKKRMGRASLHSFDSEQSTNEDGEVQQYRENDEELPSTQPGQEADDHAAETEKLVQVLANEQHALYMAQLKANQLQHEIDTVRLHLAELKLQRGEGKEAETDTYGEAETDTFKEAEIDIFHEAETGTHGETETGTHGETETGTHGETETGTHGETETDIVKEAEADTHGERETETGTFKEADSATHKESNTVTSSEAVRERHGESETDRSTEEEREAVVKADTQSEGEGVRSIIGHIKNEKDGGRSIETESKCCVPPNTEREREKEMVGAHPEATDKKPEAAGTKMVDMRGSSDESQSERMRAAMPGTLGSDAEAYGVTGLKEEKGESAVRDANVQEKTESTTNALAEGET